MFEIRSCILRYIERFILESLRGRSAITRAYIQLYILSSYVYTRKNVWKTFWKYTKRTVYIFHCLSLEYVQNECALRVKHQSTNQTKS